MQATVGGTETGQENETGVKKEIISKWMEIRDAIKEIETKVLPQYNN